MHWEWVSEAGGEVLYFPGVRGRGHEKCEGKGLC